MPAMFYRAGWYVGGPRAAPIHTHPSTYTRDTHVRARAHKRECVCKAARHRKVLRDIAPAIRPSFWELNFCGSRLRPPPPPSHHPTPVPPLSALKLGPIRAKDRALLTRDLRASSRHFLPRSPASPTAAITGQSRGRVIYESVIYPLAG